MKKALLIFAGICWMTSSFSQVTKNTWWTRDLFSLYHLSYPESNTQSGFDEKSTHIFFRPEAGYVFGKGWMVGIVPDIDYSIHHYDIPEISSGVSQEKNAGFGVGPLLRYYVPISKRIYFMPEFYLFYGHTKHTTTTSTLGAVSTSSYSGNSYGAGSNPSIVCFLSNRIAAVLTFVQIGYYSDGKKSRDLFVDVNPTTWLWGIEYHFNKPVVEK